MTRAQVQSRAVLIALRRIVRHLRIADRELEAAHGLSAAALFVLHSLRDAPARSMAELAARTFTDQSSVSTVVARLVASQLVVRTPSRADRRRVELALAPAGRRIVRATPKLPQAQLIGAIAAMPPARRAELVRSIEQLAAVMGASEIAPRMLFEDDPPRARRRGKR